MTIVLVALNVLAFVTLAYRSDYERRIVRKVAACGRTRAAGEPHLQIGNALPNTSAGLQQSDLCNGLLGLIAGSVRAHAFLTCMFLHADGFHLLANMAVLVAVGGAIERRSGRATFALVYLLSGVAALDGLLGFAWHCWRLGGIAVLPIGENLIALDPARRA